MIRKVGDKVRVRQVDYTIVGIRSLSHLGPKFFGRNVYVLKDAEGNHWTARGKNLTAHNNVSPAKQWEVDAV